MINFKKLLIASLMVPSLASLHARGHVCSVNSELLTISGGAYISYPASLESRLEGRGGELDLYLSRANRFGIHAVGQVSYMVNGNFDLGDSYNSKEESIKGTFSKVVQGGLKNITLSGRISAGKEVIFPYEDTSYLRGKEKDCSCTRFYAGLGVSIEGNKFKSRYGNRFIEVPKADAGKKAIHAAYIAIFKNSFAIDKLNSYSVMLGIDLKLFYTVGVFMISPEVFVGPSLYGRSSYNVTYDVGVSNETETDKSTIEPTKGTIKTLQDVGATICAVIPFAYKVSDHISAGVRLSFKGNYRDEEIKTPVSSTDKTKGIGKLGQKKGGQIMSPLSESIGGALSLQLTYINM